MRHKTVQECLDPWPEGLVTSVVQFGILLLQEYLISTALWYDLGNLKLGYFFFFSGFVFLLFLFHQTVVFENIGPRKKQHSYFQNLMSGSFQLNILDSQWYFTLDS